MNRLLLALGSAAAMPLLAGCSLVGMGPSQHTVVDYGSLEPPIGHGADYNEQTRYGRVSTTESRTGLERRNRTPDYSMPDGESDAPADGAADSEQD